MIFLQLRSGNSGPAFQGENQNDTLLWDTTERKFFVGPGGGGGGGVTSWNTRTGPVVPVSGDYDSDEVDNASTVAGASVSDALEHLQTEIDAIPAVEELLRTRYVQIGAPAGGDGTLSRPFTTLAEGIAALAALPQGGLETYTLAVFPGDYTSEPDIVWSGLSTMLHITAALPVAMALSSTGASSSPGLIFIPGVHVTSASAILGITGALFSGNLQNDNGSIVLTNCVAFGGNITTGPTTGVFPLSVFRSVLLQNAIDIGGEFQIIDSYLHLLSFDIHEQDAIPSVGTVTGSKMLKAGGGGPFNFIGADPGQVFVDGEGKYWAATNAITITNGAYVNMV